MTDIGWYFPSTDHGEEDWWNHSGIAHFDGAPLASLARESIQNSIDARALDPGPVHVSFGLHTADVSELGLAELADVVDRCSARVTSSEDDQKARDELAAAAAVLRNPEITLLRIADFNTKGLHSGHWNALVRETGRSVHDSPGAGGSFGIGKYAPYVVSPLRTVYYWSRFDREGSTVELFQGKSVLMSHDNENGDRRRGTGFYGAKPHCEALDGRSIPATVQSVEANRSPVQAGGSRSGTSLWVAGFPASADWQRRVARSVITNFFCAIEEGDLAVTIDPEDSGEEDWQLEINADTLDKWFDHLLPADQELTWADELLAEARVFLNLLRDEADPVEWIDPEFGACRLWIGVGDGYPSKVGLIRKTGMLITSNQEQLTTFRNLEEFAAICHFRDEKGNELLRKMENPEHNQFKVDRLPESDREAGEQAFKRLVRRIREEVRKIAKRERLGTAIASANQHVIKCLPDRTADEQFADDGGATDAGSPWNGAEVIKRRPKRRVVAPSLELDDTTGEGTGEDRGTEGGGGGEDGSASGGGGEGEGEASGGTGTRGGGRGRDAVPLHNVRHEAFVDEIGTVLLRFTPQVSGTVSLRIREAGDSGAQPRRDITITTEEGDPVNIDHYEVVSGRREAVVLHAAGAADEIAWTVQARVAVSS